VRELIIRTATGICLVILIIGAMLLGPNTMLILIIAVYGLGTMELFRLKTSPVNLPTILLAASGALLILGVYGGLSLGLSPLWLILPTGMWLTGFLWHRQKNLGVLIFFWIAIPLSSYIAIGWFPGGSWSSLLPISIIALVWINDTFAYLTGSLIGKHPMTPKLSPGKTWEGFVGGILFAMLAGWIFYHFTGLQTLAFWIFAGTGSGLFGLAGDLFESGLKRKHNVKDSGRILPGHGGILDRFGSLLFVAPAMFLLILLLQLFA
jgi:phosphatidate cytidylyltransferase